MGKTNEVRAREGGERARKMCRIRQSNETGDISFERRVSPPTFRREQRDRLNGTRDGSVTVALRA